MPLEYPKITSETCLTGTGQITLPDEILASLGLKAGDHLTFTLMPDNTLLLRAKKKTAPELGGVLIDADCKPLPVDQLPV
jgi:antitoxin PrlF